MKSVSLFDSPIAQKYNFFGCIMLCWQEKNEASGTSLLQLLSQSTEKYHHGIITR